MAARQGLRLWPVPVDGRGAVISAATAAEAMLLTPAHQFPLGVPLHPRRRLEAADWGGVVIEDDYDGEFRYDRQVRRARLAYRRRRDRLAAAVGRQGLHVTGIAAGLHAVVEFSRTSAELAALDRARDHGLTLDGLHAFRASCAPCSPPATCYRFLTRAGTVSRAPRSSVPRL
jgi:DNA-binding transcriptional MocR family regulator